MQCTKFSNIFGGGDCITLESHQLKKFPPKAGVYAVREGPILANNILSLIKEKPSSLVTYKPQADFLKLLSLGDGTAIGTKFGIIISGKWVWKMKDHIDKSFMKLFYAEELKKAISDKIQKGRVYTNYFLNISLEFDNPYNSKEKKELNLSYLEEINTRKDAFELADEGDSDFLPKMEILKRMAEDEKYCKEILNNFKEF